MMFLFHFVLENTLYFCFSIKTHQLPLKLTLIIISWCSLELPHSTESSVKLVLYRMSRLIFKSGAIFSPPFYQNSKVYLYYLNYLVCCRIFLIMSHPYTGLSYRYNCRVQLNNFIVIFLHLYLKQGDSCLINILKKQ